LFHDCPGDEVLAHQKGIGVMGKLHKLTLSEGLPGEGTWLPAYYQLMASNLKAI
jgi:hypothetical protein